MKSQFSGAAGVYYVAAELCLRNYAALVTTRNTKAVDILALNNDTYHTVGIQVKTNSTPNNFWLVGNSDRVKTDQIIYVFVDLKKDKLPSYYIVPAEEVKNRITTDKEGKWKSVSRRSIENYRDRWDIIDSMTK